MVEFGIVAFPFLAIVCAIFELTYVHFENEILANAVSDAARDMLTGRLQTANVSTTQAFLTKYMCQASGGKLPASFNCNNLIVDVWSAQSFVAGDTTNDFYKSSTNEFCPGQPGQVMVMRVGYPLGAIFPMSLFNRSAGVVNDVPGMTGNYHILMGAAIFQEENYSGTYTSPPGC